jgi:EamA domain-containing membrane protein RarD
MDNGKPPHILNASSNLLGICFILITGLKLTNVGAATLADEISLFAALNFLGACLLSYLSIRIEKETMRLERWADYLFIIGIISLFIAIAAFSTGLV